MGKTAEELRSEIDQRRDDLTRDFEAIGDKVSPSRIMERKTDAVKSRFRNVKESVMGKADDLGSHTQGKVVDLRGQASDTAQGLRSSAQDLAGGVTQGAGDLVHSAGDVAHNAGEQVAQVPQILKDEARGNPLAAGLVAFGIGLLAASVLPESRKEKQLARQIQPQLEDAARTAAETGKEMIEDFKPIAQDSAEHLQESAKYAVQNVTEQAKGGASDVAQDAKGAATAVKDSARA